RRWEVTRSPSGSFWVTGACQLPILITERPKCVGEMPRRWQACRPLEIGSSRVAERLILGNRKVGGNEQPSHLVLSVWTHLVAPSSAKRTGECAMHTGAALHVP